MMGETQLEKEQRLYREAQALKFQAREMRKKRLAQEQRQFEKDAEIRRVLAKQREDEIIRKRQAEEAKARLDRDDRIRTALLKMSDIVKANGLAFDAPAGYKWAFPIETKDVFVLHDKKTGDRVQIRTQHNGFQWD
jgi:hypothetical protein